MNSFNSRILKEIEVKQSHLCVGLDINPENSLKRSIDKFSVRFKKIEADLKDKKININDLTLKELDEIWEKNKLDKK